MENQKTYNVIGDNSRWMDSIESAHLKVTSPSGKTIRIKKLGKVEAAERELIWKLVGNEMVRNTNNVVAVTIEEMNTLLALSKKY